VFRLVLLGVIVIDLGRAILGVDMTIVIIAEVLFDSIDAVVKLTLVHLTILYYSDVDNDVGHFRFREFNYYGECPFKVSFLSELSDVYDLYVWYDCVVVYKYLLDSYC
jgi:hypothetical protein